VTFAEAMTTAATQYLADCVLKSGGNVTAAARMAGMDRSSFYRLCARCGVSIKPGPRPPRNSPFTAWITAGDGAARTRP
jgi:DNA-binding NtrC family response regulator